MKNKYLQKKIYKLAEVSFRDGNMVESQISKAIQLLKSQPTSEAIQALSEYLKQLKRKQRQHTMYVETVIPLSKQQIKKMQKIVGKEAKITKVVTNINPEILGGFKLKVGDQIVDASILGKINQIKEVIVSGRSN